MNIKVTDENLHAALLDFCQKVLTPKSKDMNLKFGVWASDNVVKNLHIKSAEVKSTILSYKFVFAAKSLDPNLKESKSDSNRKMIKTIKQNILTLFKGLNIEGKMHVYKINSKFDDQKFFIIPFNVEDVYATLKMKIEF